MESLSNLKFISLSGLLCAGLFNATGAHAAATHADRWQWYTASWHGQSARYGAAPRRHPNDKATARQQHPRYLNVVNDGVAQFDADGFDAGQQYFTRCAASDASAADTKATAGHPQGSESAQAAAAGQQPSNTQRTNGPTANHAWQQSADGRRLSRSKQRQS